MNLDAENEVSMIPGNSSDDHTKFSHSGGNSSDAESPTYRKQQLTLNSPTQASGTRRSPKRSPRKKQQQEEQAENVDSNEHVPAKRGRKPRAPVKKKVYEVAYVPQFGAGFGTIYEYGTKFSSLLLPKNKYVENVAIAIIIIFLYCLNILSLPINNFTILILFINIFIIYFTFININNVF